MSNQIILVLKHIESYGDRGSPMMNNDLGEGSKKILLGSKKLLFRDQKQIIMGIKKI